VVDGTYDIVILGYFTFLDVIFIARLCLDVVVEKEWFGQRHIDVLGLIDQPLQNPTNDVLYILDCLYLFAVHRFCRYYHVGEKMDISPY